MRRLPAPAPQLREQLREALEAYDQQKLAGASAQLERLAVQAKAAGLRSPTILVNLAMTRDALDDKEGAFRAMCEALVLDPLSPRADEHFVRLGTTLRAQLAESSRAGADEATPRLYALLSEVGETDATSQVALARYRLASGDHAGASALLEALTLVQPSFAEAWTLRADLALRQGDSTTWEAHTQRAREAQLERARPPSSGAVN
jgi:tetratricopeptide (TPR) repeat protein